MRYHIENNYQETANSNSNCKFPNIDIKIKKGYSTS